MNFEQVYELVERSSHETAFSKGECLALYNILYELPDNARIFEIGVEYGRSTTVIGCVAIEKKFSFTAIDAWVQDNGEDAKQHVLDVLISELSLPVDLCSDTSVNAHNLYKKSIKDFSGIDLIHIDGDHTYEGVKLDIETWLPNVKIGGYVCFDDYGHDSLPGVFQAVSEFMEDNKEWKFIGRYDNKLGIFKRVA